MEIEWRFSQADKDRVRELIRQPSTNALVHARSCRFYPVKGVSCARNADEPSRLGMVIELCTFEDRPD
jgi:hypothetical protein